MLFFDPCCLVAHFVRRYILMVLYEIGYCLFFFEETILLRPRGESYRGWHGPSVSSVLMCTTFGCNYFGYMCEPQYFRHYAFESHARRGEDRLLTSKPAKLIVVEQSKSLADFSDSPDPGLNRG